MFILTDEPNEIQAERFLDLKNWSICTSLDQKNETYYYVYFKRHEQCVEKMLQIPDLKTLEVFSIYLFKDKEIYTHMPYGTTSKQSRQKFKSVLESTKLDVKKSFVWQEDFYERIRFESRQEALEVLNQIINFPNSIFLPSDMPDLKC